MDRSAICLTDVLHSASSTYHIRMPKTRSRGVAVPCDKASVNGWPRMLNLLVPGRTSRFRIALVITDLDVGGAERALVSLAVRLNQQRWRPVVFCLDKPGLLVEVLRQANVPCECLDVHPQNPIQAVVRWHEACAALDRGWCRASCSMQTWRLASPLPGLVCLGSSEDCESLSVRNAGT